mmetsp:Transcript_10450/g.23201  ORF Transcript_10450/g.23201 Transcript_10450/m.23201 type:complete len:230 (-) Transcript_10450:58-747(-)|eukprot:CAMPEP_0172317530 /NCGR_PEP_ID=MMETSP1058-20130122/31914_1 /TAXON_ID=83371 /ORGANISM="Detonula confervacea, Strain CCMP 353" /LENGTH=229 /DNA_ID=CAMNT_0013032115 /DNA_START=291 /DNA_END=980 /DNA_ORIENTATION=+
MKFSIPLSLLTATFPAGVASSRNTLRANDSRDDRHLADDATANEDEAAAPSWGMEDNGSMTTEEFIASGSTANFKKADSPFGSSSSFESVMTCKNSGGCELLLNKVRGQVGPICALYSYEDEGAPIERSCDIFYELDLSADDTTGTLEGLMTMDGDLVPKMIGFYRSSDCSFRLVSTTEAWTIDGGFTSDNHNTMRIETTQSGSGGGGVDFPYAVPRVAFAGEFEPIAT